MDCVTYVMSSGIFGGITVHHEPYPHIPVGDAGVRFAVQPWAYGLAGFKRPVYWHKPIEGYEYEPYTSIDELSIGSKVHAGKVVPCAIKPVGKKEIWKKKMVHLIARLGFKMIDMKQRGVTLLAHGMSGPNSKRVNEYLVVLESGTILELLAPSLKHRFHLDFESSGCRLRGYTRDSNGAYVD